MSDKAAEIIDRIRKTVEKADRIKLKKVLVDRSTDKVSFEFINDKAITEEGVEKIKAALADSVPEKFADFTVDITKIVADKELVEKKIDEFIKSKFVSIAHHAKDMTVETFFSDGKCEYVLKSNDDMVDYLVGNKVVEKISEYLSDNFCDDFYGRAEAVGTAEIDASVLSETESQAGYEKIKCRTMKVIDPIRLWGEELEPYAAYIADCELAYGKVSFCGVITSINQKETKTGKTFYLIELDDGTGKITGKIFMTKEKEKKFDKINVGSTVLTGGELSVFNGMPSYKINDLSFCELPTDFVPEEKPTRGAPEKYSLVFPSPLVDMTQRDMFSVEREIPECLKGVTFVVLDIETTGTSYIGGDKITEIGAVKIENGAISESFQTLLDPGVEISEKIISLTGIDNEMVKGQPKFEEVLPDLYKFCDGAIIVAHNAEFDCGFIKFYSKPEGYEFKNGIIDTLALSRETLPGLKNYKLNTVCEYFGIEFLHHRALSDAHATAKMFLELIFIKKCLPKLL
ncbi:MAG: 3'-5' exoribonuclease [Clostridia bacterium]|nr:3'-5' exoribonuclease [Clostridia bacterium]